MAEILPFSSGILITNSEPLDADCEELLEAEQYRNMLLTAVKQIRHLEWLIDCQDQQYRHLRERITVLEDNVQPRNPWRFW